RRLRARGPARDDGRPLRLAPARIRGCAAGVRAARRAYRPAAARDPAERARGARLRRGPASVILVGVDVGTTAVKAAAFDSSLNELSRGRAATPWAGTELDPAQLLDAAVAAIGEALPEGREVAAVGVAGMAETGVLVDASGVPVVPSIAWHDTRGA